MGDLKIEYERRREALHVELDPYGVRDVSVSVRGRSRRIRLLYRTGQLLIQQVDEDELPKEIVTLPMERAS